MLRQSLFVVAFLIGACDSPQVVSFNTPESCVPNIGNLPTFTEAQAQCGKNCSLCVESELDDQALTYSVSHDENCVCAAPKRVSRSDAGTSASTLTATDAGSSTDPGDASPQANTAVGSDSGTDGELASGSDGCGSRMHLTRSQARALCNEWTDCNVCVERVDFDGDARSYMAHQCACPDAYRVDP